MNSVATMPAPWNPTHFITYTPTSGDPQTWLVMLSVTPNADGLRQALTKQEWLKRVPGEWRCDTSGRWFFNGRSTPDGQIGRINVSETSGGYRKIEFTPTHLISFYPKQGDVLKWLVMVRPNVYRPGYWSALTHEEWFSQCPAEWGCDAHGQWTWNNLPTPKGLPGAVYVEDISSGYPVDGSVGSDGDQGRNNGGVSP